MTNNISAWINLFGSSLGVYNFSMNPKQNGFYLALGVFQFGLFVWAVVRAGVNKD